MHCFLPLTFLKLWVSLTFMVTGRVVFLKTQICRTAFHALRLTQKWQNFLYRMCCLQNSRQSTRHCASFFVVWGSRCSHLSFAWEEREHGDPLGYHANLPPEKERRKRGRISWKSLHHNAVLRMSGPCPWGVLELKLPVGGTWHLTEVGLP